MSSPQSQNAQPKNPAAKNPWHGLLHAVAERLIPLFQLPGQSTEYARAAALEAISAYHAESRADYASIGRILALSLASIAAIGNSADPDLPPSLQLRFLTRANTLSRSAEQAERGMNQRRRQRSLQPDIEDYLIASPEREAPAPAMPAPEVFASEAASMAAPEPADEAVLAQIDAAMADFRAMLPNTPGGQRPPFAAIPAPPPPLSLQQALRSQAPIGIMRATG